MTKKVKITDRAGRQLAGLLETPDGRKSFPLVILMHGNPGWKEEPHLATLANVLTEAGIAALRFDAPGLGESEGTWADDYRASNFITAIYDVTEYAQSLKGVTKIGLWGHSMGGMAVLIAASRQPEHYAAVCGDEPSTGASVMDPAELKVWRASGLRTIRSENFGVIQLPYAFYEDRIQYRTEVEVAELKLPALFIAGTTDDLVDPEFVHQVYLAAAGPKSYLEFPMNHFYKRRTDMMAKVNANIVLFFASTLLTGNS
jgi:pimeloyl-ACP methyl ester carboxylesterase